MEKKSLLTRSKEWVCDHQEEISIGAGIVTAIAVAIGKVVSRNNRYRLKEEKRMNNYIYDPSTGLFWKTRRRSSNDNLIIAQRKANGEPMYKILSDMRLLK